MDQIKKTLFSALLSHVPFDGWSDVALRQAARETGTDLDLACDLFPDALAMIDYHHDLTNAAMHVPAGLGTTASVKAAILSRLEFVRNDRDAVRMALSILTLPQNWYGTVKRDYRTADAIWTLVGSQDRGFDWVTKRTTLLGVYGATLLYWLREEDMGKVEAYLDRQLERLIAVMKPIAKAKQTFSKAVGI